MSRSGRGNKPAPRAHREHLRRRPPGRRVPPDRLARHQRPTERPARDPSPGRAGHRSAAVQPLTGRPRPGHPSDPHHRPGDPGNLGLRSDLHRHALQLRRTRCPLQRPVGQRALRRPQGRSAPSSTACSGSASTRSSWSSTTSRCSSWCAAWTCASRSSPRRRRLAAARSSSPSTSTAEPGPPSATWPSSGTPGSCTSPDRGPRWTPSNGPVAGATSSPLTASRSPSRSSATGRRRAGTASGSSLDVEPGVAVFVGNDHMSIGLLSALRERGPAGPGRRQRGRLRRRPRGRLPVPAADHGPAGLRHPRRDHHAEGAASPSRSPTP